MAKKHNSLPSSNGVLDSKQRAQSIIDEMKNQGLLDNFIDPQTGEALFEMQFSNETLICKVQ